MKPMLIVAMLLEAVIMLVLPYLSPRPIFFGVRTGVDFRGTEQGRRIRLQYWAQVLAWAAVSLALLLGIGGFSDTALGFAVPSS